MPFTKIDASNLGGTTLPALNGSALTNISAGKTGQITQAYRRGEVTTTSSTFQDFTQLTGTITPTATSSKILVQIEITSHIAPTYVQFIDFKRSISGGSATQIGITTDGSASQGFVYNKSLSGDLGYRRSPITFLDTPNTTSEISYFPVMKSETNGQTAYIFNNGNLSTIQLTEILAWFTLQIGK